MVVNHLLVAVVTAAVTLTQADDGTVVIDDGPGVGRMFDGIGGLSGGGATSKLLVNYPQKQRDEILDYLFKPQFGASLQILKVEIGGDAQSTDGTESSHMHYEWEEPNFNRGYEWWLIKEAKKRNSNIKLAALPWTWPGWIGDPKTNGDWTRNSPYQNLTKTADYVVRWVEGAKQVHGLDIDYVGIWNERSWQVDYVNILRAMLDARGFPGTRLVVGDSTWNPGEYVTNTKDFDFAKNMYAIGAHYPGTYSNPAAQQAGPQLWSSEDFSTTNDENGGGCWARVLNQNYVNGYMSSTIAWNLVTAYYKNLRWYKAGLMTAAEPWSGNYIVAPPIWITAHTTQFTEVGWYYLTHGNGVGHLPKGGSIVTLMGPDMGPFNGQPFSVIIETMSQQHAGCVRPGLPNYSVEPQTITIQLQGAFLACKKGYHLSVRYSKLNFDGTPNVMFEKKDDIKITDDGKMTLSLGVNEVWTLSTSSGQKGNYSGVPASQPFPLPYTDDFEVYSMSSEPYNLAQQMGVWEVQQDAGHSPPASSKAVTGADNQYIRQMLLQRPVCWCEADGTNLTLSVIGDYWSDIFIETDFRLPTVNASDGILLAARVEKGGCHANNQSGIFFTITKNKYAVYSDITLTQPLTSGSLSLQAGAWHKASLLVQGSKISGAFDGKGLFSGVAVPANPSAGFAAIGSATYGLADFDNFKLDTKAGGQKIMAQYFKRVHPKSNTLFFVPENH